MYDECRQLCGAAPGNGGSFPAGRQICPAFPLAFCHVFRRPRHAPIPAISAGREHPKRIPRQVHLPPRPADGATTDAPRYTDPQDALLFACRKTHRGYLQESPRRHRRLRSRRPYKLCRLRHIRYLFLCGMYRSFSFSVLSHFRCRLRGVPFHLAFDCLPESRGPDGRNITGGGRMSAARGGRRFCESILLQFSAPFHFVDKPRIFCVVLPFMIAFPSCIHCLRPALRWSGMYRIVDKFSTPEDMIYI